jgi:hypothetical protein
MNAPAFSVTDRATWGEVLTLAEVAAIYRRQPSGIAKSCQQRQFIPAPFRVKPYHWRKTDVVRHLDAPQTQLRRVG